MEGTAFQHPLKASRGLLVGLVPLTLPLSVQGSALPSVHPSVRPSVQPPQSWPVRPPSLQASVQPSPQPSPQVSELQPALQPALASALPPESWPVLLLSSMAFWLLASLLVGLLANQLPAPWLESPGDRPGTRQPASIGSPPAARPAGIRVWKRWIPDAGGALPGGVRKASLVRRDAHSLRRLLLETRRAELVHWLLLPGGLLTALWLPPAGVVVNLVFALAFNLPCLLLQRDNRARLRRCLGRARSRAPGGPASSTQPRDGSDRPDLP